MFDLKFIQQIADTNEYLWMEVEDRDDTIKGLKAQLAFLRETVFRTPDGDHDHDLLDKVQDILAEEAWVFALEEDE